MTAYSLDCWQLAALQEAISKVDRLELSDRRCFAVVERLVRNADKITIEGKPTKRREPKP